MSDDLVKRLSESDPLPAWRKAQAARIAELEATLIKVDRAAYQKGFKAGQESQTARIAELEAALRPFAGMAEYCELDRDSESACVFVGDLRAARAALEGGKK